MGGFDPEAVALGAGVRGGRGVHLGGVHDGRIVGVGQMILESADGIPVEAGVFLAGFVTGFTGDAELADGGVHFIGRCDLGLRVRRVAATAVLIPFARDVEFLVFRRGEEGRASRQPTLLIDPVDDRRLFENAALAAGEPIDLHVVRAGDHGDVLAHTFGIQFILRGEGVVHFQPVLVAGFAGNIGLAVQDHRSAVEIALDGVGRGEGGHGAVVGVVPGIVFGRMTGAAGIGGDIAVLLDLQGAVGFRIPGAGG